MNDERLLREVGSWLREGDPEPPDAHQSVQHAMERMPQVRQRSRWWPLPVFYRRTQAPTTSDTTEYQPSPTPASNGQAPTVIGRTQSMLSPVKAITAGAIVFAIGGAFLIAQPFGQQSDTTPALTIGEEPAPPVPFSGLLDCGGTSALPVVTTTTYQAEEGTLKVQQERGRTFGPTVRTISDPRLEGTYTIGWSKDIFFGSALDRSTGVSAGTWRIENDGGAWQGSYHTFDTPVDGAAVATVALVGEGDYEGLTAMWEVHLTPASTRDCPIEVRGLIIDGDLPAYPEVRVE